MIIGVYRDVGKTRFIVIVGDVEYVFGSIGDDIVERQLCQRFVHRSHTVCKGTDDLHGDGRIAHDEFGILIAADGNAGDVGDGDNGFDLRMPRHTGDNADKVTRAEEFNRAAGRIGRFKTTDIAALNNKEAIAFCLSFDDEVRSFSKIYK